MKNIYIFLCLFLIPIFLNADKNQLIVVFEEWPPYQYTENNQVIGTDTEILQEVLKQMNIEPVFLSLSWARALLYVETGEADIIFSLSLTEKRQDFLYFVKEPISSEKTVFYSHISEKFVIQSLADIKGKRVDIQKDHHYPEVFNQYHNYIQTISNDIPNQLRKLLTGRCDLIIGNELVIIAQARKMNIYKQLKLVDYTVAEEPLYVGFSKKGSILAKEQAETFSSILKQLKEEGFVKRVIDKYRK
ncbi:MAG: transporter substrate-binding domain-containing protein [Spirochaetes bacterium]|nr:transporter substrate-binding domain-containing protein [Spirochaetota bacterium]